MKKPLIGVNGRVVTDDGEHYYRVPRTYLDALHKAGGLPVLMPYFASDDDARAYLERLDGLLFTGGADFNPKLWGAKKLPETKLLDPEREESDLRMARLALDADRPLFGICCGLQLLNVATKGSLFQHLPKLGGKKRHDGGRFHEVELSGPSRLRDILGASRLEVNSYHHQAIDRLSASFVATAHSPDGVVEAIESPGHRFALAVQWHPERIADRREQLALFKAFVDACGR